MATQGFVFAPITAQSDGPALTNSTAATSILPTQGRYTLANNFFGSVGKMLRVRAMGRISTVVTTPGTLTFSLRFGAGPVIVATSDALALNIVAKTNVAWDLEWLLTARAVGGGTSANLMHNGKFTSEAVIGSPLASVGGQGVLAMQNSAPVVGTGFDSTAAQIVDFFATWSIASASNSITLHQFLLEDVN